MRGTGLGLVKGLAVTLKHALRPSITQQYPEEKPDLPPRTRGVIALKEANCTVCYKCSRECPDWCIYIDAHKETHDPASGGKARSAKVLDRFAIDYALCMYCGICVEVCPFDALFWSPEFEYAEYGIDELIHEKEKPRGVDLRGAAAARLEVGAEPQEVGVAAATEAGSPAPVRRRRREACVPHRLTVARRACPGGRSRDPAAEAAPAASPSRRRSAAPAPQPRLRRLPRRHRRRRRRMWSRTRRRSSGSWRSSWRRGRTGGWRRGQAKRGGDHRGATRRRRA